MPCCLSGTTKWYLIPILSGTSPLLNTQSILEQFNRYIFFVFGINCDAVIAINGIVVIVIDKRAQSMYAYSDCLGNMDIP